MVQLCIGRWYIFNYLTAIYSCYFKITCNFRPLTNPWTQDCDFVYYGTFALRPPGCSRRPLVQSVFSDHLSLETTKAWSFKTGSTVQPTCMTDPSSAGRHPKSQISTSPSNSRDVKHNPGAVTAHLSPCSHPVPVQ